MSSASTSAVDSRRTRCVHLVPKGPEFSRRSVVGLSLSFSPRSMRVLVAGLMSANCFFADTVHAVFLGRDGDVGAERSDHPEALVVDRFEGFLAGVLGGDEFARVVRVGIGFAGFHGHEVGEAGGGTNSSINLD
jgi:hypothetical protein